MLKYFISAELKNDIAEFNEFFISKDLKPFNFKELDDVQKQFDVYKAKMESLLISQLEILKEMNKEDGQ